MAAMGTANAQINPNPDCRTGAEGRPTMLGVSGGNYNSVSGTSCCTGTIGALVHDKKGIDYLLSTNSVLARGSTTGHFRAMVGEKIVQPGLVDTGCFTDPQNGVATLSRWIPLSFGLHNSNSVDAAIAKVNPGMVDSNGFIFNIGPISSTTVPPSELAIGEHVQKMGRTSCLTEGGIDAMDASGKVAYANNGCRSMANGNANFVHQILIIGDNGGTFANTSAGGSDGGSMVLTEDSCPRAIGMIFATTANGITVINPIDKVLQSLKVSIVAGCSDGGGLLQTASEHSSSSTESDTAMRESIEQVRIVKDRHEDDLLKLDAVAATAIGRGDKPGQAAMLVFVKKDSTVVRAQIPDQIEGVPVKIIESGEFTAL